jgi:hypothetical protein
MIELKLIRKTPKDINQKFTHGELIFKDSQNKWLDFCYTLEDQVRDINMNGKFDGNEKKVYGQTAIPFGKYNGEVTYSYAFERDMPLIKDVPEFEGIRLHGGNDIKDTLGCILIAHNTDNKGHIWDSAENELTQIIKQNGNKFTIEIT